MGAEAEDHNIVEDESPTKLGLKGTFNKVIQTIQAPNGANKDNAQLRLKNIESRALTLTSAIPNVRPGHGQHLIRGDYNHQIIGNRHVLVSADDTLRVGGDQIHDIEGDAEFLYNKKRNQATLGDEEWVVQGNRECYVIGQSVDNFIDKHDTNAPESFEWKHEESSFIATINENCYFGNSLYAMKTEIGIVDNDLSLTGISFDKLHVKAEELVSGIKEALEDEAATEALENPETAAQAWMWTTEAATATAGLAVGAKNWVEDKAGKAWSAIKAHPIESGVIGVAAVGLAVAAVFVGPEDMAALPAIGEAVTSAGTWLSETVTGAGAGAGTLVPAM
ncbi:hypothetical protein AciX8_4650 [Granulicella mallensis MP5ACTX8]|uniref:Uncharacterized protein n=2 Tax=Granulicella mallensis TaxID=940614 RepID=G8NWN3_GRAMM|nr:hypothetical protein AciX8_4650 [Granulicella mallensis MP5ACTX8]